MPARNKAGLTKKELAFIRNFAGDQTEAAKLAGYKRPREEACRLMKKKHIVDEIERRLGAERNESAAQLAKRVSLTRSEIINGLHKEAQKAESDSARVSAWSKLAEIYKLTKPTGETFEGWNDEELEAYVRRGTLPAWYGPIGPEVDNGSDGSAPGESPRGAGSIPVPSRGQAGPGETPVRAGKSTGRPI